MLNSYPYKKSPKHGFFCKWSVEGVLAGVNLQGENQAKVCFQKSSISLMPQGVIEYKLHYRIYPALKPAARVWTSQSSLSWRLLSCSGNFPKKGTGVRLDQSTPTAARGWVQQLVKKFWVGYQKHLLHWGRREDRHWGNIDSHFWHSQEASLHIYWKNSVFYFFLFCTQ